MNKKDKIKYIKQKIKNNPSVIIPINKYIKETKNIYREMYYLYTYVNSNPYHMLEKRCNCPSCHQAFGHYTSIKKMEEIHEKLNSI